MQAYSAAVDIRQKLFEKDSNSLRNLVTLIAATVRSSYGKTSKEAAIIASLVAKIQGVSIPKKDKEAEVKTVSQSERSFGSMTQNFSDVIKTLENYGTKYNPGNTDLTTVNLRNKLQSILEANVVATSTYGQLKNGRNQRSDSYKLLKEKTQRIKDAVKGQYGSQSTEYNLIRRLAA
ncbi:MAG: hypothetical protein ABI472_17495 [Ginsengibacter sp.]